MPANVAISQDNTQPYSEADIRANYYNPQQIIAGSNQNSGNPEPQAQYWSDDGGTTWHQSALPVQAPDDLNGDPAVGWTSDGTAWALTNGINFASMSVIVRCFKSTNGGQTWTFDAVISGAQTATDKPSIWVDRSTTATKDNIYAVWHLGAQTWVAVRNGPAGAWAAPLLVSGNETTFTADGSDIKTNSQGHVFAFWPDAGGQRLLVAKSTNGGGAFGALPGSPVTIANTFGKFTIKVPAQANRLTSGAPIGTLIAISGGAYNDGTQDLVFACWHDLAGAAGCNTPANAPAANAASPCKTRVWFARSIDGGAHWQAAQKINDQAGLNDQFFPRLAVDEATGNVMIVYYDSVNDPNRLQTDIWAQSSTDGGAHWSPAVRVTTAATNEAVNPQDNGQEFGDYIGLTAGGGRFFACWTDRRGGGNERILGAPIAIPHCEFIMNKQTFGQDEVAAHASYPGAYFLAVDGFTNESLGFNAPTDLNAPPNPAPVITATLDPALNTTITAGQRAIIAANLPTVNTFGPLPILPTDATLQQELQRFMYPYTISFGNSNAFNALEFAFVTLSASLTVGPLTVTASAVLELAKGEDPYFNDLDPNNPNSYPFWLSFDLRFFKVTPSQTHLMFSVPNPTSAADAVTYIQNVLTNLNHPANITNGDTFETTLQQSEDLSALEYLQRDTGNNLTFNYAVARVRINGNTMTTIDPVRVFFRLFQAASTVSNFEENTTYRWGTDGTANHKIALLGVQNDQHGNPEYVTIPCFATDRINLNAPADMHGQHDDSNARSITVVPGAEVDTYFGCWIDVNQPGQQFLIPAPPMAQAQWDGPFNNPNQSVNSAIAVSPHQCMIAEIRFDDTPIPHGATSSTSDKLAQRNIAWIDGPNPGTDPSRVMPQPFEVRSTPATVAQADELMITWGNTPAGSKASLYLPAVNASEIIALANAAYASHALTAADAHTVSCPVGGVTFMPIPKGMGRFAGLLSVELPAGIVRGDVYHIAVRQITEAAAVGGRPGQIAVHSASVGKAPRRFTWRQLVGAFQVTITISMKEPLLYPEERLLSWLKWRISVTPHTNRWYPVLLRYIELIGGRVAGFGGNPGQILPSPYGDGTGKHRPRGEGERHIRATGKVAGLIFDRFGDFEGFILDTEDGERTFYSREREIKEIAKKAWCDRLRITVVSERDERHRPLSIVVHPPPASLDD